MARPRKNRPARPQPPMCYAGKIARLPHLVRMELNRRMRDGESGVSLIEWLNALPAVRERMRLYYKGKPITSANLSNWRRSGYADWSNALPRHLVAIMDRIAILG